MAISPSDLRIGNWVYQKCTDEQRMVTPHDIYHYAFPDDSRHVVELNDLHPIPLTPEILLACGFESYPDGGNVYSTYGYQHDDSDFFLQIDWRRRDAGWWPMIKFSEFEVIGINIKHLHQLQNLYYSLTHQELIYKS